MTTYASIRLLNCNGRDCESFEFHIWFLCSFGFGFGIKNTKRCKYKDPYYHFHYMGWLIFINKKVSLNRKVSNSSNEEQNQVADLHLRLTVCV